MIEFPIYDPRVWWCSESEGESDGVGRVWYGSERDGECGGVERVWWWCRKWVNNVGVELAGRSGWVCVGKG